MPDHEDVRGADRAALREEIARLQAEAERLRTVRGGADPEQVARLRAQVGQLAAQNDRLASTLRDARDQIVERQAEFGHARPAHQHDAALPNEVGKNFARQTLH